MSLATLFSIEAQLLRRNVKWFRGGFVVKARRLLHHSTLGPRVMKKRREEATLFNLCGKWLFCTGRDPV